MVAQYLFVFTLARLAGPGNLGSFTLSYTIVQLLVIIALLGLDNLLTRQVAIAKAANDERKLYSAYQISIRTTILTSGVLSVLLFLLSSVIAEHVFHKPALTPSLQIIAISVPFFTSIVIHSSAFRGLKDMFGFTFYRTAIPIVNTMVLLISYYFNLSLLPVFGFTTATIMISFGYYFFWKKNIGTSNIHKVEKKDYQYMLKEALPMLVTGSIFFILNWIDNLFIGFFKTEADVGIYDTAFKIAASSAIILQAINAIQGPMFAEFKATNELKKLRNAVFRSNRLLFIFTLPITIFMLAFPKFLLGIFGSEFTSGALCLSVLAISNMISAICGSVGILLQMTGHQVAYNRIVMTAAIVSVALNILLIPKLGILGAALASSTAKIFQNVASSIVVYKKLKIFSVYIPWLTYSLVEKNNKAE